MARRSLCLVVAAVACACFAASAGQVDATFPPQSLPYCNLNPTPIPALSASSKALNPKLELVNVFLRHGDRTLSSPGTCWPNDQAVWPCQLTQLQANTELSGEATAAVARDYRLQYLPGVEDEKGCAGIGQLTKRGYDQEVANGQHLRDAYVTRAGLLPETYEEDPGLFFLRADNSRRTQMSGQALFSGLYPTSPLSPGHTRVFPFYTRDEEVDDILPNAHNCPMLTNASEAVLHSPQTAQFEAQVTALLDEIGKLVGQTYTFSDLSLLWDCLHTHICHQFPIPDAITQDMFDQISNYTLFSNQFSAGYNNSRVARLGMGPLIAEMYGNMKAILNGTEHPTRFWLYSGHDTGPIMPMLFAYHVHLDFWCPYASMITVELYSADTPSGYAVRFVYNGDVIHLDGCGAAELCDYDAFAKLTEEIIPTAAECGFA